MELRPQTKIRSHQDKSLSKIFIGGKARSGVVVLPCGAGKTLLGISAINILKKRSLIFCVDNLGIQQWKNQIKLFTDLPPEYIITLSSKGVDWDSFCKVRDESFIILTTYNMISKTREQKTDK